MTIPLLPDLPGIGTFGPRLVNALPLVDPEADLDAGALNNMRATLAALARTAPKALVHFTVAAGIPTLDRSEAVWLQPAPPGLIRVSAGIYVVTWPLEVYDLSDAAELHNVVLWHAQATISSDPTPALVTVDAVVQPDARSVVVTTRNAGGPVDITHCYLEAR